MSALNAANSRGKSRSLSRLRLSGSGSTPVATAPEADERSVADERNAELEAKGV